MENKNTIQYLAYLLDKAKRDGNEKAIVFIGAGMSVSAGIPLTGVIVRHIKLKFWRNEMIREYKLNGAEDYYILMGMLTADERRDLFHFYVTREKVKLNIANIYLAQLLRLDYLDYIVTVNFDDLILKASTLFNTLPPVYDLSNIKTITTTDIRTKSVIYLHGQYFGQWLLNNKEELEKVEKEVLGFFNSIKTRRTWITIGYSGNDGIFEKIKSLGSFSNEFFWVQKKVKDTHIIDFIETPNNNVNKIEGFYADSFFLKLHAELSKLDNELKTPAIFNKPFSFLKSMMQNVSEINEDDELHNEVKGQINICNDRIDKAIEQFENEKSEETLSQKILNKSLKKEFKEEDAKVFENEIKINNYSRANKSLSWYYNDWGIKIYKQAVLEKSEKLFKESFKKYIKSTSMNPLSDRAFNNWGIAIYNLAKMKQDEKLFKESFKKYEKSIKINPLNPSTLNNWGLAISTLAEMKQDEKLFKESFKKYEKSIKINPNKDLTYHNWGIAISNLARMKQDEKLFEECFEKYERATMINSKNDSVFNDWANAISELASIKNDKKLFEQSLKKYKKATIINPKNDSAFKNWGISIYRLAELKKDEGLFKVGIKKLEKAITINPKNGPAFNMLGVSISNLAMVTHNEKLLYEAEKNLIKATELGESHYNLACCYALLNNKEKALHYLKETLDNKFQTKEGVINDEDWKEYLEDEDFKALLAKY